MRHVLHKHEIFPTVGRFMTTADGAIQPSLGNLHLNREKPKFPCAAFLF